MTVKQVFPRELIVAVPSELREQFHQHQLDTSVHRLKLLCVVLVAARIIHILLRLPSFLGKNVLDILSELAQNPFYTISFVLLFYISVTYFSKKGMNRIVWLLCHLFVIVNLSLSAFLMFLFGDYITLNYFWSSILLTLIPNFKPKVFLTLGIMYFVATIAAIINKYQIGNFAFGDPKSFCIEIFVAITVIKVLLYNGDVKTFVKTFRINSLNEKLEELSITDELTKLNNRRSFLNYMDMIWKQSQRLKLPLSVMMIDVDYFKKYNDSLGHLEGDKALISIAQCLKNHVKRETDFVARFGGEEFVCLLPFIEKEGALNFAKSLVQSVENMEIPHPMNGCSKYVTVSVGMATVIPDDTNSQTQLLDEADKALYMAKEAGRNQVVAQ